MGRVKGFIDCEEVVQCGLNGSEGVTTFGCAKHHSVKEVAEFVHVQKLTSPQNCARKDIHQIWPNCAILWWKSV